MRRFILVIAAALLLSSCQNIGAEDNMENRLFTIEVGGHILEVQSAENSSASAFIKLLEDGPITISMRDYGSFEKVGSLGTSLPRNDTYITTTPGDVILYQGNQVTIYYDENSWSFTRLGHITNVSASELRSILGGGSITAVFSL